MRTIKELRAEIRKYEKMLSDPNCKLAEQTWIELQIKELKKELKQTRG